MNVSIKNIIIIVILAIISMLIGASFYFIEQKPLSDKTKNNDIINNKEYIYYCTKNADSTDAYYGVKSKINYIYEFKVINNNIEPVNYVFDTIFYNIDDYNKVVNNYPDIQNIIKDEKKLTITYKDVMRVGDQKEFDESYLIYLEKEEGYKCNTKD